jgi:Saxitoxin biosynthesis operon protein SxtJ
VQRAASSRSFGLLLATVCAVIAGLSYWSHGRASLYWVTAAALLLMIALAMPRTLAPLKRLWLKLGKPLHLIASPLILSTVYVLVFIPIGAVVRLFGKDLLALKRNGAATSYWIDRSGGPAPDSLKDQF